MNLMKQSQKVKTAVSCAVEESNCNFSLRLLCPLARKEIKRSGFPASATGWGEFLKRDNANSHSVGFLCGMDT